MWRIQILPCYNRETCFGRTIWPIVCAEKFVDENTYTFEDDPAKEDRLQKYQERVERLSQQNHVIKFCTDAGFLTTVDVGQYFVTKDTDEFSQFAESVACREYILPRDEKSSDPKGWIRGNTQIGPVLEVTTSYLQGKYGVETRIEPVNKDNPHSWTRISHGLNRLVADLNKTRRTTKTSKKPVRCSCKILRWRRMYLLLRTEQRLKQNHKDVLLPAHLPIGERKWTDIEPEDYSPIAHPVSKQLSTLLRHCRQPREDDGAIEFCRFKDYLRNDLVQSQHWSDEMWKSSMGKSGGNKKYFNVVLIHHVKKFFISELFKVIQDAISLIFHYKTVY